MPVVDLGKLKTIITKGVTAKFGPEIVKGALVDFFKSKNLDVPGVVAWVNEKKNLWDAIGPEHQQQMKRISGKMVNLDFLTVEWAIDGLRKDFPAVASLFIEGSWKPARNWLQRELENIKQQVQQ